jgi:hypothetical protein
MPMAVPLSGGAVGAHHSRSIQLGDSFLTLQIDYQTEGQWAMDVYRDGSLLCGGCMLLINADIIGAWGLQEDIGALTMVGAEPTLDNLGIDNELWWYPPDESIPVSIEEPLPIGMLIFE